MRNFQKPGNSVRKCARACANFGKQLSITAKAFAVQYIDLVIIAYNAYRIVIALCEFYNDPTALAVAVADGTMFRLLAPLTILFFNRMFRGLKKMTALSMNYAFEKRRLSEKWLAAKASIKRTAAVLKRYARLRLYRLRSA